MTIRNGRRDDREKAGKARKQCPLESQRWLYDAKEHASSRTQGHVGGDEACPMRRKLRFQFDDRPEGHRCRKRTGSCGFPRTGRGLIRACKGRCGRTRLRRLDADVSNCPRCLFRPSLTAGVATALAELGMPCNMIATYHHDNVVIPEEMKELALSVLEALQYASSSIDGAE